MTNVPSHTGASHAQMIHQQIRRSAAHSQHTHIRKLITEYKLSVSESVRENNPPIFLDICLKSESFQNRVDENTATQDNIKTFQNIVKHALIFVL